MGQFDQIKNEESVGANIENTENLPKDAESIVAPSAEEIKAKEDVKAQNKIETDNRIKELQQELTGNNELNETENEVLQIGINLHLAMKEEEEATRNLLARGMAGSNTHYVEKWENLNKQFNEELEKIPDSREKILAKLRSENTRLGLEKNQYTGEYLKSPK